jgi:hypothetical protein
MEPMPLYMGGGTIVQDGRRIAVQCVIDFSDGPRRSSAWRGGYELENPDEGPVARGAGVLELESGSVVDVVVTHVASEWGEFDGIGPAPGSEEVE